jgi:hypothetical protein
MQINWFAIMDWPNYAHLSALLLGGTQIWFVLHCKDDLLSRWDKMRFFADLALGLVYFVYAGTYYHQGASVIATLFACSLVGCIFCAYHSGKRSFHMDMIKRNTAYSGEVLFSKTD